MSDMHQHFMKIALREAKKGVGRTSPNPCVGAVIVDNGRIVGSGFHRYAGGPHAEINALNAAGDAAAGSTMYVTLEPCNHFGRTPPCSHAIVGAGITHVVIGMSDPNPRVAGGGSEYLREHGVLVEMGVLEEQCREINRPFIKHVISGLPWVAMKAGMTLDGKISYQKGMGGAITNAASFRHVHRLRDRSDAILVGIGTVLTDDPELTTRKVRGAGKDPVRVVLDSMLRISTRARLVRHVSKSPTWIVCTPDADQKKHRFLSQLPGVEVITIPRSKDGRLNLVIMLEELGRRSITSVLVEGGAQVHGSFLTNHLVDYAYLFYAPMFSGDGGTGVIAGYQVAKRSEAIHLHGMKIRRLGEDILVSGEIAYPGD